MGMGRMYRTKDRQHIYRQIEHRKIYWRVSYTRTNTTQLGVELNKNRLVENLVYYTPTS